MSTRGDYASRALLLLSTLPRRRVGPHVGQRHRRAHGPPPALPRADPPGTEGRWPGAIEARRGWWLCPGTAALRDLAVRDRQRGRRAHRPRGLRRSRTPTAPATTRANACCSRSGAWSATRCALSSTRTPWPTSRHRPAASGRGQPRTSDSSFTRSDPPTRLRNQQATMTRARLARRSRGAGRPALAPRATAATVRGCPRERRGTGCRRRPDDGWPRGARALGECGPSRAGTRQG